MVTILINGKPTVSNSDVNRLSNISIESPITNAAVEELENRKVIDERTESSATGATVVFVFLHIMFCALPTTYAGLYEIVSVLLTTVATIKRYIEVLPGIAGGILNIAEVSFMVNVAHRNGTPSLCKDNQ